MNADSHAFLKSAMTDPEVEIAAKLIFEYDYPIDHQGTHRLITMM
jgi:hypothetical protein